MRIEARNIRVALGSKTIISGIDLTAPAGQLTAIVGPNGSGKSTLIKALSGELRHDGSVTINRFDTARARQWQLAAMRAVLPQSASLAFPFTVREIVRLGLTGGHCGLPPGQSARLHEEALRRVDLEGFAGRFYQELSGGEQQRVQLARVLCQVWKPVLGGKPRYLMLDEPVSSLDIRHQLIIMNVARQFADQGGGVIAVMHDLNLTAMFADEVVMRGGRLVAVGAPREVLTDDIISGVFGCQLRVGALPAGDTPFVLPQSAVL